MNILDSHVHFWDPDVVQIPWIETVPILNRAFTPGDLKIEAGDMFPAGIVFVQADVVSEQSVHEVEWVTALAAVYPEIKGIVAFAPLEYGAAVRDHLEQLRAYPLVKGIRRLIQSEGPGFATQDAFIHGVRLLAEFDLSFDICVLHHQLDDVLTLVERCPHVPMVLDHIGKPAIKDGRFEPWRDQIRQLAQFDHVMCKLSGMVTEADHQTWTRDDLKPYIDHVMECFGVDRVMYGGDWPVSKLATNYPGWIETVQWATEHLSEDERRQLFWTNATRFYRLEEMTS